MKKSMFLSISLAICVTASAFALDAPAVSPAKPETPVAAPATPADAAHATAAPDKAATPAPAAAEVPLAGKVVQTMNAGGYSYIYIERADGSKKWVAVSQMAVKVGDQLSFKPGMEMGKFESKALNRSFDSIIFSEGVIAGASAAVTDPEKNQGVSPGSQGAAKDVKTKISVPKATGPNAATVADAYSKAAKLHNKKVVIHGQVVKVSVGIMGKNWIHIQDGTGSEKKKTHNLVCTSKTDMADVGDVVTITGTLIKDRDFGAGYKYPVIIEDTKVTK